MVAKASVPQKMPSRPVVYIVVERMVNEDYTNTFYHGPFMCEHEAGAYAHGLMSRPHHASEVKAWTKRLNCNNAELIGLKDEDFASNWCDDCHRPNSDCKCHYDDDGNLIEGDDEEDEDD